MHHPNPTSSSGLLGKGQSHTQSLLRDSVPALVLYAPPRKKPGTSSSPFWVPQAWGGSPLILAFWPPQIGWLFRGKASPENPGTPVPTEAAQPSQGQKVSAVSLPVLFWVTVRLLRGEAFVRVVEERCGQERKCWRRTLPAQGPCLFCFQITLTSDVFASSLPLSLHLPHPLIATNNPSLRTDSKAGQAEFCWALCSGHIG